MNSDDKGRDKEEVGRTQAEAKDNETSDRARERRILGSVMQVQYVYNLS
jgi:hypothetical protein